MDRALAAEANATSLLSALAAIVDREGGRLQIPEAAFEAVRGRRIRTEWVHDSRSLRIIVEPA